MAAAAEEDNVPEVPVAKSGTNKILPIILVVNTLLMTGVLIFVMKRPAAQASAPGKEAAAASKEQGEGDKKAKGEGGGEHGAAAGATEGPGPILKLENFIVQVRATEGDRYAHLTVELEIGGEADKKSFETRMPHIRDGIIGYLSDRSEDDLRGSEGLTQLKEALIKRVDEIIPGHRVRGLFITEFIIQ